MTISHAAAIHFDGRREYAKKRIQKLKYAGFITERPRRLNEQSVLVLARRGLMLLRDRCVLAEYPRLSLPALLRRAQVSERTVCHELEVMDVKAAFYTAARSRHSISIAEFGTWPRLYEFEVQHFTKDIMTIRPDGFLRISEQHENGEQKNYAFFVEVDRSTETLDTIVERVACYQTYYRTGGFAERCGKQRDDYRQCPFRVLIVCKSILRRDSIAQRLLQYHPPVLRQVLLSMLSVATGDPLGTIWMRPSETRLEATLI